MHPVIFVTHFLSHEIVFHMGFVETKIQCNIYRSLGTRKLYEYSSILPDAEAMIQPYAEGVPNCFDNFTTSIHSTVVRDLYVIKIIFDQRSVFSMQTSFFFFFFFAVNVPNYSFRLNRKSF